MDIQIVCRVNGSRWSGTVPPTLRLLDFLRDVLGLTGTKEGCGEGECGACTVLMDGKAVDSCLVLAAEADGHEILTIEGLQQDGQLDPLQEAFVEQGAVQCGYCIPGMIMSAKALLSDNPAPTQWEIKRALAGNLCRCTGYAKIVKAVETAAERVKVRGREIPPTPLSKGGKSFSLSKGNEEFSHDRRSEEIPRWVGGYVHRFRYESPLNLEAALRILHDRRGQVRLLAGGTDLLVAMQDEHWPAPEVILSLKNLEADLRYIRNDNGAVHVGALCTYSDILHSELLREKGQLLVLAGSEVGSPQIRNRGTLAGNIATASPSGDAIPALYALGASVVLRSVAGSRTVAIEDCFVGPKQHAFRSDEMVVEMCFPAQPLGAKVFFYKVGPRRAQAITKVTVAGLIELRQGRVESCRLAFGAVAPTVVRAPRTEELLRGQTLSDELIVKAARLAKEECSPIDDIRSEAWYRREMVGVLLRRGLRSVIDPAISNCTVFPD